MVLDLGDLRNVKLFADYNRQSTLTSFPRNFALIKECPDWGINSTE